MDNLNTINDIEYAGVDYHTKFAVATRMSKDGVTIAQDKILNNREDIRNYLTLLPQNSKIVLEATNNWYAFVEWSHDLPIDVKLAHPLKLKAIATARIKTDNVDSKILADLLRSNFIPESYIAPKEVRDIRELIRYRTSLVRIRTEFVVRIHSVLMSVPGISFFSSLLITSEIGDYKRFPSSKKLCSFAGLVPSVYSSGGKTRLGKITKLGSSNLRFVLLQAVPHVVKKSKHLGSLYLKISRKHGAKVGRIAVARRLLAVMLSMLKNRQEFKTDC